MITLTGLEKIKTVLPGIIKGKRVGVLCHAPSVDTGFNHITEIFSQHPEIYLTAIFGPQHGIFGETQDNMIEWEGRIHPTYKVAVYSLYGAHRKPTQQMLESVEILVVDMQDVGARLYTYIWTLKLCMEACAEKGIPVVVLDRPNPISLIAADGPVLKKEYYTFVGGAEIPLCHRMTIGEMALWIKEYELPGSDLHVVKMDKWKRNSLFHDCGIQWILPSPNMPTQSTAIVYPGTVLFEATNISEGRGTTIPFELFGAPFINTGLLIKYLKSAGIEGCLFREHDFIPTFHKFEGEYCHGVQIHVTDTKIYQPVKTMLHIMQGILETSPADALKFLPPPYEYEDNLMPFDILSGDESMRRAIISGSSPEGEFARWEEEISHFSEKFSRIDLYQ